MTCQSTCYIPDFKEQDRIAQALGTVFHGKAGLLVARRFGCDIFDAPEKIPISQAMNDCKLVYKTSALVAHSR